MNFFQIIANLIAAFMSLFVQYDVTFGTPNVVGNASLTTVGINTYTVNISGTKVNMPFTVKSYKSFVWKTNAAKSGGDGYTSKCVNLKDSKVKYENNSLTVTASDDYARQGRVIAYKNANCTGTSKEYKTAVVSYKAPTPAKTCNYNKNGTSYTGVCDASSGGYKNIGTQGFNTKSCNCYAKAYALRMVLNKKLDPNVGETHEDALQCWKVAWAGDYYVSEGTDDRTFPTSKADTFDIIRDALVDDGRPVMALVNNSSGNTHWLLITAIKTDSIEKSKSNLTYSDFWAIDSVGSSSVPTTSEAPKEKNWSSLISGSNRELKYEDGQYQVTEMNK